MEIKIASEKHFKEMSHLRWNFKVEHGQSPSISEESFENQFVSQLKHESERWTHFIVISSSSIIGMVSVYKISKIPSPELKSDSIGYLTNTYITQENRSKGIGEKLLKFAINWTKQNQLELLFVWPSQESKSFYSRLGFNDKNDIMELLFD